jgi:hypothetical protein
MIRRASCLVFHMFSFSTEYETSKIATCNLPIIPVAQKTINIIKKKEFFRTLKRIFDCKVLWINIQLPYFLLTWIIEFEKKNLNLKFLQVCSFAWGFASTNAYFISTRKSLELFLPQNLPRHHSGQTRTSSKRNCSERTTTSTETRLEQISYDCEKVTVRT